MCKMYTLSKKGDILMENKNILFLFCVATMHEIITKVWRSNIFILFYWAPFVFFFFFLFQNKTFIVTKQWNTIEKKLITISTNWNKLHTYKKSFPHMSFWYEIVIYKLKEVEKNLFKWLGIESVPKLVEKFVSVIKRLRYS